MNLHNALKVRSLLADRPLLVRRMKVFACLAALVAANVFLRWRLERASIWIVTFIDAFFPEAGRQFAAGSYHWWEYLLPNADMWGSWTTTTLILTHVIEKALTAPVTWVVYNALVVLVSFGVAMAAFESLVFSCSLALCMGFGTHLYAAYATGGPVGLNLLIIYLELLLLTSWRAIMSTRHVVLWQGAFVVVTLITALAYESWLDFLIFTWLAAPFVAFLAIRIGRRDLLRRIAFVGSVFTFVGIAYLLTKTRLGYGQYRGAESDVIFNYPLLAPAVEDFVSNVFTNLYMALTNFLPPMFLSSTALASVGPDQLVALQHGYHKAAESLVPMHYVFMWRYYAGVAATLFAAAFVVAMRKAVRTPSRDTVAVAIFMLLVLVGGPTHALIKFRPMNGMPLQTYHVLVAVLGVALLIAYGLMRVRRDLPNRWASAAIVGGAWIVILFASLTRPTMINVMAAQVGYGEGLYPDPWHTAATMLHLDTRETPGVFESRVPRTPARPMENELGLVSEGSSWLPELELPLPPFSEWQAYAGSQLSREGDGVRVVAETTRYQYIAGSPRIPVPQTHMIVVRLRMRLERGHVCVGVLNSTDGKWITPPVEFRQQYTFDTAENDSVRLVIANCNPLRLEKDRASLYVWSGSYADGGPTRTFVVPRPSATPSAQ